MRIDTGRGITEIIDDDGHALDEGEGTILATSLFIYALPFLRYSTQDVDFRMDGPYPCGRGYPLLKEVLGRQQEMLITSKEDTSMEGFFNHIF